MKNEKSLQDDIYQSIIEGILSQEYVPGEILHEKNLVEKYECSKTPVREALLKLCNDNVLRSIPRYGYEIVGLTRDEIQEMLQFRWILESNLLKESYQTFTQGQLDQLRKIDSRCLATQNDIWAHWASNTEFHLTMISFCNNSYAMDELSKCMSRLKRAYAQFYWNQKVSVPIDTRNHPGIIEALENHDIDQVLIHLKDDLDDFHMGF